MAALELVESKRGALVVALAELFPDELAARLVDEADGDAAAAARMLLEEIEDSVAIDDLACGPHARLASLVAAYRELGEGLRQLGKGLRQLKET